MHDGFLNHYTLRHRGKPHTLVSLTPQQLYEFQLQKAKKSETSKTERKNDKSGLMEESENKSVDKKKSGSDKNMREDTREKEGEKKLVEKTKSHGRVRQKFYSKPSEVLRKLEDKREVLIMVLKQNFVSTNDISKTVPSFVLSLLQEYDDVFPEDKPSGLSPFQGIKHQIDFIPRATLPNRPAYRANPEETKEI